MNSSLWAVMPAAGIGSRMGAALPKQYLPLAGATVIEHSVAALAALPELRGTVLALAANDEHPVAQRLCQQPGVSRCTGGEQRSDSVLAGLNALSQRASDSDWVLVHDAARPCVSAPALARLLQAVQQHDCGAILALPVTDTVKQDDGRGRVAATIDRSALWCAQTPQLFRLGELRAALQQATGSVTDEASAMEAAGWPVQLIPGETRNLKITRPQDLALAEWYLAQTATIEDRV